MINLEAPSGKTWEVSGCRVCDCRSIIIKPEITPPSPFFWNVIIFFRKRNDMSTMGEFLCPSLRVSITTNSGRTFMNSWSQVMGWQVYQVQAQLGQHIIFAVPLHCWVPAEAPPHTAKPMCGPVPGTVLVFTTNLGIIVWPGMWHWNPTYILSMTTGSGYHTKSSCLHTFIPLTCRGLSEVSSTS